MRTHVSFNACLYRVTAGEGIYHLGYGRHVNPKGHYNGAPVVALSFTPGVGYFWS